jgi:hypothetical protein
VTTPAGDNATGDLIMARNDAKILQVQEFRNSKGGADLKKRQVFVLRKDLIRQFQLRNESPRMMLLLSDDLASLL